MFGIGLTEILLILVVALLVVGPKKLPELARTLGRGLAEFRRTADEFKESIYADEPIAPAPAKPGTTPRRAPGEVEKVDFPQVPPEVDGQDSTPSDVAGKDDTEGSEKTSPAAEDAASKSEKSEV